MDREVIKWILQICHNGCKHRWTICNKCINTCNSAINLPRLVFLFKGILTLEKVRSITKSRKFRVNQNQNYNMAIRKLSPFVLVTFSLPFHVIKFLYDLKHMVRKTFLKNTILIWVNMTIDHNKQWCGFHWITKKGLCKHKKWWLYFWFQQAAQYAGWNQQDGGNSESTGQSTVKSATKSIRADSSSDSSSFMNYVEQEHAKIVSQVSLVGLNDMNPAWKETTSTSWTVYHLSTLNLILFLLVCPITLRESLKSKFKHRSIYISIP